MPEYSYLWRNKWLTSDARTIDDMIDDLKEATAKLEAMKKDGITLSDDGGVQDDYTTLITKDPAVAEKYYMEDRTEMFGEDEFIDSPD